MSNYYDMNAKEYIEGTINCDMSFHYQKFLNYLHKPCKILDVGFGSGRDMIYFKSLGYNVEGIDTSIEFIKNIKNQGFNATLMSVTEMNYKNQFDAIWACASLLHIKRNELEQVILKCIHALKKEGIMYCSFKYGNCEYYNKNRYFNNIDENIMNEIANKYKLKILEMYISNDIRKHREKELWINFILISN